MIRSTDRIRTTHTIADRIVRFAELVGRDNVVASADCGFSSQASYPPEIHPTIVWASSRPWPRARGGPPPGSGEACKLAARPGGTMVVSHDEQEAATAGSPAIEKFLTAIQTATIPDCDAWSTDATLDATVPNWRLHTSGRDAIRAEYARWFADPGQFGELRRCPVS